MKKCIQCGEQKNLEEFYAHPATKDRRLPKCKECVKEGRRSEEEKIMARVRDKNRESDPKRKEQKKKVLNKFRTENPEKWKAEQQVSNFLRYNKNLKPTKSIISGQSGLLHYHHPDYSKPNEVIPCTPYEHRQIHAGKIEEKKDYIIILPF